MPYNRSATYRLAFISVWTALLLACVFLIIYPIPGTPASITFSSVLLSSLTAPLLGPVEETISAFIFGWLAPYINPATSIGILTFLAPTMAVLTSSLFLFGRWKEATVIFICQLLIWFAHPFAWYELMPIITWQYWLVLAFLVVPPIRNWIINAIVSRDEKRLPLALWCLAWIARIGGDVATGNNIAVWVLGWAGPDFYPWWAPMTLYYAVADTLNCIMGALIGTAVLLSLKRSKIEIAIDFLHKK